MNTKGEFTISSEVVQVHDILREETFLFFCYSIVQNCEENATEDNYDACENIERYYVKSLKPLLSNHIAIYVEDHANEKEAVESKHDDD